MIPTFDAPQVLAALGTYLLHSTLLLGLAWLFADRLASLRAREWAWRAALLGGLVTGGLQLGLGFDPLGGRLAVAEATVEAPAPAYEVTELPPAFAPTAAALPAAEPKPWADLSWHSLAAGLWILGGLAVATAFLLALVRLRHYLARRRLVTEGPLAQAFSGLKSTFPIASRVRLYSSRRVGAPIASGLLHPSITVPERAARDLDPSEQRALLAHELGHLQRRDPAWLTLARVLEIGLFLQPLNRLAHRRLAALAEFQCDAAALRATGDRVALARCLTNVAGWLMSSPRPLPACGMADQRSPLAQRVVRILEAPNERRERLPLGTTAAAGLALAAVTLAAPGFAAPPAPEPLPAAAPLTWEPEPAAPATSLATLLDQLTQQRDLLQAELADITQTLAEREATPELQARLQRLQARAGSITQRLDLVQALASELQARLAAQPR